MSKVKKLQNISNSIIFVIHSNGMVTSIPPKGILENTNIVNLAEIKDRVSVTIDLTEVKEVPQKMKLRD